MAALQRSADEARDPWLREHVTPYMRGGFKDYPSGGFQTVDVVHEADFSHLRWTVDTAQDLEVARGYFKVLGDRFTWQEALALATRRQELMVVSDRYGDPECE